MTGAGAVARPMRACAPPAHSRCDLAAMEFTVYVGDKAPTQLKAIHGVRKHGAETLVNVPLELP